MHNIINMLNLRLAILKRLAKAITWKGWLKTIIITAICLLVVWGGIGKGVAFIYKSFNADVAAKIIWLSIIQIGIILILEGAISMVKKLYRHPENAFFLALPIDFRDFFKTRWLERSFVNLVIIFVGALALCRQSQLGDISWTAWFLLSTMFLFIQQTQLTIAVLYSRKMRWGNYDLLFLGFILMALIAAAVFLLQYEPNTTAWSDFTLGCIVNLVLILSALALQHIFVRSYYNEYNLAKMVQYSHRSSFHRLLAHDRINSRIKALLAKDIVLLLCRWPVLQSVLTAVILILLSAILYAKSGSSAAIIVGFLGGFIIFSWSVLPFVFEDRQSSCLWLLKSQPLTGREIWWSKYLFILLIFAVMILLFLIPMLIGRCSLESLIAALGILMAQAVFLAFLVVSVLFVAMPHYKAGEYFFTFLAALGVVLAVSFPLVLPIIFIPFVIINFNKGVSRFEQMEL